MPPVADCAEKPVKPSDQNVTEKLAPPPPLPLTVAPPPPPPPVTVAVTMHPPAGAIHVVARVGTPSATFWLAPKERRANDDALGDTEGEGEGDADTVAANDDDGEALEPYETLGEAVGELVGTSTQAMRVTEPLAPWPLAPPT